ncbi:hypothetical protein TURU_032096 [Turdus rufiventris]|nr:hypothetical protein TURU_032096 [Turdus rufiventris]
MRGESGTAGAMAAGQGKLGTGVATRQGDAGTWCSCRPGRTGKKRRGRWPWGSGGNYLRHGKAARSVEKCDRRKAAKSGKKQQEAPPLRESERDTLPETCRIPITCMPSLYPAHSAVKSTIPSYIPLDCDICITNKISTTQITCTMETLENAEVSPPLEKPLILPIQSFLLQLLPFFLTAVNLGQRIALFSPPGSEVAYIDMERRMLQRMYYYPPRTLRKEGG